MRTDAIEKFCLTLPGATLSIQWGADRVFKVGGKMFAAMGPKDARPQSLSFKTAPDSFAILTEMAHIVPAPYLARAQWVQLTKLDALPAKALKAYLARAHAIVAAGLPKKTRVALGLED
ncbi:MAG: MmcQ/YjbR family DNA-binding protein [Alphaproteobacteria bacterium]|nr:MmcQ/YjbR family DNA-binding protein [Alphaproteobacteria bacterium]MBV9693340.1 MmcQ/YjbR family DNA-binding protein [Alphaproteobacteria bacterium]